MTDAARFYRAASVLMNGLACSFIVRPHTQDTNASLFNKNFVYDTVLNIDATRVCAGKIADQLFEGWWIFKWVVGKNREQFLGF